MRTWNKSSAPRTSVRRIPLVIVDEVGYIPFDPDAAALFFALGASLIVSSNKTFSSWAEIFGDPVAVAAMVDRLVHHAEVIVLQGDSYRLKDRGQGGDRQTVEMNAQFWTGDYRAFWTSVDNRRLAEESSPAAGRTRALR